MQHPKTNISNTMLSSHTHLGTLRIEFELGQLQVLDSFGIELEDAKIVNGVPVDCGHRHFLVIGQDRVSNNWAVVYHMPMESQ